jgi:hypothetical protein
VAELSHSPPHMPKAQTPISLSSSGTSQKVFAQILLSARREKLGGSHKVAILRTKPTSRNVLDLPTSLMITGFALAVAGGVAAAVVAAAPQHPGDRYVGGRVRLGGDRGRTHRSPRAHLGPLVHHLCERAAVGRLQHPLGRHAQFRKSLAANRGGAARHADLAFRLHLPCVLRKPRGARGIDGRDRRYLYAPHGA